MRETRSDRLPAFPLTIYYDASCPLCASEMQTLKARDTQGRLVLADCSAAAFDPQPCAREGVTREQMLERIHARDAAGRWFRGVDVFEVVYEVAGFTRLARLLGSRRLRPLLDRIYPWIAANRYRLSRLGLFRVFALIAAAGGNAAGSSRGRGKTH
jgi:predicted DCC family thiol-disulfide oxidoreductase YuxK